MSDELDLAFQYWKTAEQLRLDFIERLGQYKLDAARADLVHAVAASQWALARMKARIALELEASLQRLRRMRTKTRHRILRLERHARAAAKIRSAEDLPPNEQSRMWAAIRVLERVAPDSVIRSLSDTKLTPSSRSGDHYAFPSRPETPCADVPQSIDNVHALIAWLMQHRCVPRRGTEPYRQIIAAIAEVAAVAATHIQQLETALKELEQGTFKVWQPLVIAGLPDTLDVKKIIRTGL